MGSRGKLILVWGTVACAAMPQALQAQSATRDLSGFSGGGVLFNVVIQIDAPSGTPVVGLQDGPPVAWVVGAISDGGSLDAQTGEVKWGPFFEGSIPSSVSYEITPPNPLIGEACFAGTASFGGPVGPIGGQRCLGVPLPAVSAGGFAVIALAVLAVGVRRVRFERR